MKDEFKSAYNTKPVDVKPGDQFGKVIVAVVGYADDWAAYEIEVRPDGGMPDAQVAADNGEKIDQQSAERLFPVLVGAGLAWRD